MALKKSLESSRILVLEDDADIRRSLQLRLAKEGFAVQGAETVAEARGLALRSPFELYLLDISLPDEDGLSFCRWLRRSGWTGPVIFLTARDTVADKILGLETGGDDYLCKPYDFGELAARVRAQLRRAAPGVPASPLHAGPVTLDPARKTVTVDGKPAPGFTDTEFELLALLVRASGKALARGEILRSLWGYAGASVPDTRTVDMHVSRIRFKLGRAGVSVKSVPGVGYRFQP